MKLACRLLLVSAGGSCQGGPGHLLSVMVTVVCKLDSLCLTLLTHVL